MMTRDEVLADARDRVKAAGTMRAYGKSRAISIQAVSKNLSGTQPLASGFLRALGYERVEAYRKIRG